MRYSALQNVTLNLPRLAYEAGGDDTRLFEKLRDRIMTAAEAHREKRDFITRLLSHKTSGPLTLLNMDLDGTSYLRMHRCTYLIGMVGMNELIQYHTGEELHGSVESMKFGLKVIAHMKLLADELSRKYDMRFVLEQTPAESTAYRFAKLDLKHFPEETLTVVKGNRGNGEVYYTNSTLFDVGAPMNPIERVQLEGRFHPLIEAGALTHVWLGESKPPAESLADFVIKTFNNTKNDQIAFSPEFTCCKDCSKVSRGLQEVCPWCHSTEVDGITRITGYFTRVSSWNKGKIGELKDRYRNQGWLVGRRA
jgi:ribonucleoside-triphosphate reductase